MIIGRMQVHENISFIAAFHFEVSVRLAKPVAAVFFKLAKQRDSSLRDLEGGLRCCQLGALVACMDSEDDMGTCIEKVEAMSRSRKHHGAY